MPDRDVQSKVSKPNREIERKYLLRALPPRTRDAPAVHIHQGYLPGDRITERVRRTVSDTGARYYRTIKAGQGIDRMEIEETIDETFFSTVWPLTRGRRVEKRRYLVADGDLTWEIDEFLDREGFWLGEVELESAGQRVIVPEWLAEFVDREVTDEPLFTNYALSK
jgi:CYTH domain-containing protein